MRIITALAEHNGRCDQRKLAQRVSQKFGRTLRVNNLRRAVLRNPALLAFEGEDVIALTPRGVSYSIAYDKARGDRDP